MRGVKFTLSALVSGCLLAAAAITPVGSTLHAQSLEQDRAVVEQQWSAQLAQQSADLTAEIARIDARGDDTQAPKTHAVETSQKTNPGRLDEPAEAQAERGAAREEAGAPPATSAPKDAAQPEPEPEPAPGTYDDRARRTLDAHGCRDVRIAWDGPEFDEYRNANGLVYPGDTTTVLMRSSMPSARVEYIAAHECAHILQHRIWPYGNRDNMRAVLEPIYGTSSGAESYERAADCVTKYWGLPTSNSNYAIDCSAGDRPAATRALAEGRHP